MPDTNTLILAAIALLNLITGMIAWQSAQTNKATQTIAADTRTIAEKTRIIAEKTEVHTNSMKDALVAATAKASHAEGVADQKVISQDLAAALAKGQSEPGRPPLEAPAPAAAGGSKTPAVGVTAAMAVIESAKDTVVAAEKTVVEAVKPGA